MLTIIPAIDLKGGKCVRLLQGRDDLTTEYSADPVEVAERWVAGGATRMHIVNLDGAFGRASQNHDVFRRIAARKDVLFEFGGGLRTTADVLEAAAAGAHKVVLGTVALEQPAVLEEILRELGPSRVIGALDAEHGVVMTRGWVASSGRDVMDVAREMQKAGVQEVLYTDVSRDGMLTGPDVDTLTRLAGTGLEVIASGGVSSLSDLTALAAIPGRPLAGVIIGKALYEGKFTVAEAIRHVA